MKLNALFASKRKLYLLTILFFACIFTAFYFLFRYSKDDAGNADYPQLAERGEINVVTDYNAVGYYVSGDTLAGFNYELIKLLQHYTPLKINLYAESQLEKSIDELKSGKYDIIARNIPVTTDLKNTLSFTDIIIQNKLVLVQRKKEYNDGVEPLRSQLDLAGKKLYVPNNSPSILRIRNLSREIGDTVYYVQDPLYGQEQLMMKVAAGEIDYAVCDEKNVRKMALSIPEIDYGTLIGFTHFEAWAVRETSPILLDSLNLWLGKIKDTKEYKLLLQKYYTGKK